MRRVLSILLLLVVGLPLFAFVPGEARAGELAMCCRRAGAHHCVGMGMGMAMGDPGASGMPGVHATCPAYPRGSAHVQSGVWFTARPQSTLVGLTGTDHAIGQAKAGFRVATNAARQKRGPPTMTA